MVFFTIKFLIIRKLTHQYRWSYFEHGPPVARILGQNHEACNFENPNREWGRGITGFWNRSTCSYTQFHGICCLKETLIVNECCYWKCQSSLRTQKHCDSSCKFWVVKMQSNVTCVNSSRILKKKRPSIKERVVTNGLESKASNKTHNYAVE